MTLEPANFKRTRRHRTALYTQCNVKLLTIDKLDVADVKITYIEIRQHRFSGNQVQIFYDDGSSMVL